METKKSMVLITLLLLTAIHCYNPSLAKDEAYFSSIAYESIPDINGWKCPECSQFSVKAPEAFFSSVANIQGFGAYDVKNNAVFIAFRGSADIKNWIYNLDTASVVYPFCDSCRVHQGFYNAYKGVAPLVQPLAKKLISSFSNAKFYITGHSLGGAMAIHCALDMRQIGIHVDAVYTFGQPRVGNQNFANFQGQLTEVYRLINYADIVPHVPPSSFGFKHGNPEIWYTPRGMKNYKVCVPEDPTCSNSIPTTQLSTDDHSIKNYETLQTFSIYNGLHEQEFYEKMYYSQLRNDLEEKFFKRS